MNLFMVSPPLPVVDNPYTHSRLFNCSIYIVKVYNMVSWEDCQELGVGFVRALVLRRIRKTTGVSSCRLSIRRLTHRAIRSASTRPSRVNTKRPKFRFSPIRFDRPSAEKAPTRSPMTGNIYMTKRPLSHVFELSRSSTRSPTRAWAAFRAFTLILSMPGMIWQCPL